MNENNARSIYKQRIDNLIASLLPNGYGTLSETRLRTALDQVAQVAFRQGESYTLSSLMTVQDVALELGISERRVRAIAQIRHERFGIGWKVPGTRGTWLFRPIEIDALRPGPPGRPASK